MRSIFLLVMVLFSGCKGICSNEILYEKRSPDGNYIATVFERNCGATTPFVRVVALRPSKSKFDPESHQDWVFTIKGQAEVRASWVAAEKLRISYSGTGEESSKLESWREITIEYE